MTRPKMSPKLIESATKRYEREYDRYAKLAEFVYEKCMRLVREAGVQASVQRRTKTSKSFREKLPRKNEKYIFENEEDIFLKISDLAGVRINLYMDKDLDAVFKAVRENFPGPLGEGKPIEDQKSGSPLGYRATHFQVGIGEEEQEGQNWNLKGASCEIQVSTILAHVFNEISHDIAYKPTLGDLNEIERKLLDSIAGVMVAGDAVIAALATAVDEHLKSRTGEFEDAHDFIVRVRDRFPSASQFSQYAASLYDEMKALGITTLSQIEDKFCKADGYEEHARTVMWDASRYGKDIFEFEGATSDILLLLVLEQHYLQVLENHPTGRGHGRPGRIATAARTYKEWVDGGKKHFEQGPGLYLLSTGKPSE